MNLVAVLPMTCEKKSLSPQSVVGSTAKIYSQLKRRMVRRGNKEIQAKLCSRFNSSNGLDAEAWGPHLWHYLHLVSLNYRKRNKKQYQKLLRYVFDTLPCGKCRDNIHSHAKIVRKEHRRRFGHSVWHNRLHFARYIYALHIRVNKSRKPRRIYKPPSFEQMCNNYLAHRA